MLRVLYCVVLMSQALMYKTEVSIHPLIVVTILWHVVQISQNLKQLVVHPLTEFL